MDTSSVLFDRNDPTFRFINKSLHIGTRLIALMDENNWALQDFAEKLNVSQQKIKDYLGGNHDFTLREITAIESILKQDIIKIS